jgi:uncharacterized membrane protein YkoI
VLDAGGARVRLSSAELRGGGAIGDEPQAIETANNLVTEKTGGSPEPDQTKLTGGGDLGIRGILPGIVEFAEDTLEIDTDHQDIKLHYRLRSPSGRDITRVEVLIDGKIYEIEVAEDGILQEKKLKGAAEIAVNLTDCPAAVQRTLNREANGAKIDKVDKDTTHGRPVYEIDVNIDGRNYEILVAEDGLLLSKELDKGGELAKAARAPE